MKFTIQSTASAVCVMQLVNSNVHMATLFEAATLFKQFRTTIITKYCSIPDTIQSKLIQINVLKLGLTTEWKEYKSEYCNGTC